jgi:hypothetical protein
VQRDRSPKCLRIDGCLGRAALATGGNRATYLALALLPVGARVVPRDVTAQARARARIRGPLRDAAAPSAMPRPGRRCQRTAAVCCIRWAPAACQDATCTWPGFRGRPSSPRSSPGRVPTYLGPMEHMHVGAQPHVVGRVPARMIRILVDDDVVAAPPPVGRVAVRRGETAGPLRASGLLRGLLPVCVVLLTRRARSTQ